jgi:ABC-type transporter MlaC component
MKTAGTLLALALGLPLLAGPGAPAAQAQQLDARGPEQTVKATITDVMDAIGKDPAARAGDPDRTFHIVQQRFLPATDFRLTTQYAVGQAWAQATPAQREALFTQFQTLLARTYAIVVAGGDTMPIDYRMHKSPSGWKIYDINMMGAWMIPVYRQQFAGQLASGGIDGLIKYLAAHNRTG